MTEKSSKLTPDLEPELLWSRMRERLSALPNQMALDLFFSSSAEFHQLLSPARRTYLAEQMLAEIAKAPPGKSLTQLQLAILDLVSPFLSTSDQHLPARIKISFLFEKANWPAYSDRELDALATGASILGAEIPLDTWMDFLRRRKQDGYGIALFNVMKRSLQAVGVIATEFSLDEKLEKALIAAYPALVGKYYSEAEIARAYAELIKGASTSPALLRTFLGENESSTNPVVATTSVRPSLLATRNLLERVASSSPEEARSLAEYLGGGAVLVDGLYPETPAYRNRFNEVANIADKGFNGNAGLFVSEFLRGSAKAAQKQIENHVSNEMKIDLRTTLIQKFGHYFKLDRLVDELCNSAPSFGHIRIYSSIYLEDQIYRNLIGSLITSGLDLDFLLRRWQPSIDVQNDFDLSIDCEVARHPDPANRYLYEFKGYHVFAVPSWLHTLTKETLPEKVRAYLKSFVDNDFDIDASDRLHSEYALAARAWLALHGGIAANGGFELDPPIPYLKEFASSIGVVSEPQTRIIRGADETMEQLFSGSVNTVLLGAIHGDLIARWWDTRDIPLSLRRVRLIAPQEFASIMRGKRFLNHVKFGSDNGRRRVTPAIERYTEGWVTLLREVGRLLTELSHSLPLQPGHSPRLRPEDRTFLLNFLFVKLGQNLNDQLLGDPRPKARWAFVPYPNAIPHLLTYDDFRPFSGPLL